MVIFTKKFGTLDPHLPIVWDKVPKKTFFLGTFPNIANIAPSSNPWSPSNAIKYSKKETEDSLLDTFDNIEEEEFFEVEKMITSSKKSTKSGTNQVWDNTELVPHQQEDNSYLKYFNFYSIHIFHHLLWISKTHHVPMRLCCKFNLYILCVQRNNVSQPNHIQLLFRLNFKLHIYFAVQVDNISY